MKILVISDSHGNLWSVKKVLDKVKNIDMIFHLGDNVRDAIKIEGRVDCPVKCVKGNTDFGNAPLELVEYIKDKRFLLTHGHKYGIKSDLNRLYYTARENDYHVVLFGHTHQPHNEIVDGILFFNPGSIGDKRWQPNETYGVLTVDEQGNVQADIFEV